MRNSRLNSRFVNHPSDNRTMTNGNNRNATQKNDHSTNDGLSKERLSNDILSLEKRHMVEQLQNSLAGKKPNEALTVLMKWQRELQEKNIQFTPQENELLTQQLYATLNPAQKKQFELLKGLMKK